MPSILISTARNKVEVNFHGHLTFNLTPSGNSLMNRNIQARAPKSKKMEFWRKGNAHMVGLLLAPSCLGKWVKERSTMGEPATNPTYQTQHCTGHCTLCSMYNTQVIHITQIKTTNNTNETSNTDSTGNTNNIHSRFYLLLSWVVSIR